MILYTQILLIVLAILTYIAYFQALQMNPFLASIFMILGFASGVIAFMLVFFAFEITSKQKPSKKRYTDHDLSMRKSTK
jgi:hypothetical protein